MQRSSCTEFGKTCRPTVPHMQKDKPNGKQDIKVATNNNKKASDKCLEMATQEKLYKTFLELHIQRFKFYSYIYYLHKLPLLIARN